MAKTPKTTTLRHILILMNGDTLVGQTLETQFDIKSGFGSVTAQVSQIAHIHFAGPPGTPVDETQLVSGDRLTGDVSPAQVQFQLQATGGTVVVPKTQIHTAIFSM